MNNTSSASLPLNVNELPDLIVDSIQDNKGKRIVKLDLRKLDAPANFFIICEAESTTQAKGIADNVKRRVKHEAATHPSHVEGEASAQWICIDYFDVVVHIFHKEARSFYDLERLWSDAKTSEYQDI